MCAPVLSRVSFLALLSRHNGKSIHGSDSLQMIQYNDPHQINSRIGRCSMKKGVTTT